MSEETAIALFSFLNLWQIFKISLTILHIS